MLATSETVLVLKYAERDFESFTADDGRPVPSGTTRKLTVDAGDQMETYRVHQDAVAKAKSLKTGQSVKLQLRLFQRGGVQIIDIAAG